MGTEPSTGLIVYIGTNSAGQQEGPGDSERPPVVVPVGLASREEQVLVRGGVKIGNVLCDIEGSLKHRRCSAFPCGPALTLCRWVGGGCPGR